MPASLVAPIAMIALVSAAAAVLPDERAEAWVARANGEPISVRLFEGRIQRNRAAAYSYFGRQYGAADSPDFWTSSYGGETPREWVKQRALAECVRIKLEQIVARDEGVIRDISYAAFLEGLKKENERRTKAVAAGEPIYGPVQYEEDTYFGYVFSNMVIEAKRRLGREDLSASEAMLRQHYERIKDERYKLGDRVKVWRISVPFRGGQGESGGLSKEEARARIEEARARLEEGEAFGEVARSCNEDGSVGEQIFDDSTSRSDSMARPRAREEAMKLSEGEASGIFEERGGLHMVMCLERTELGYMPFEEVAQNVRSNYIDQKYEGLIDSLVERAEVEVNRSAYEGSRVR